MIEQKNEVLALDTECRRLNLNSPWELISVALVSSTRGPLLATHVRPRFDTPSTWEKQLNMSERVLEYAPTYQHVCHIVRANSFQRDLLVWNAPHEKNVFPFLNEVMESGRPLHNLQDLMRRCAPLLKPWNSHFGDYQWPKLRDAAGAFGFEFELGGHHRAVSDAQMLIRIWQMLEDNPIHLINRSQAGHVPQLGNDADEFIPF